MHSDLRKGIPEDCQQDRRPFQVNGTYLTDPIMHYAKYKKTNKSYILFFTYSSTKAIHLEHQNKPKKNLLQH